TIIAFTVLHNIESEEEDAVVDHFNGLARRNPYLAACMAVSMLSLAGIPPLAGFFGKYYLFTVAFESGYVGLVLLAVLTSLIGIYYYFRIIIAMYLKSTDRERIVAIPAYARIVLVVTVI